MGKESVRLIANNKKAYHDYFIDETYVSQTTIGKFVDDGSSQPSREVIVDECSDVGS